MVIIGKIPIIPVAMGVVETPTVPLIGSVPGDAYTLATIPLPRWEGIEGRVKRTDWFTLIPTFPPQGGRSFEVNRGWKHRPMSMSSTNGNGTIGSAGGSSPVEPKGEDKISEQEQRIRKLLTKLTKFFTDGKLRKDAKDSALDLNRMLGQLRHRSPLDESDIDAVTDYEAMVGGWQAKNDAERKKSLEGKTEKAVVNAPDDEEVSPPADEAPPDLTKDLFFKAGDTVYHILYGPVKVVAIEMSNGKLFIKIAMANCIVSVPYEEESFFPLDSQKAAEALAREVDLNFKYLPLVVGLAYMRLHWERYSRFMNINFVLNRDVGERYSETPICRAECIQYLSRTSYTFAGHREYCHAAALERLADDLDTRISEDDAKHRKNFWVASFMKRMFIRILEVTGDDLIELGFMTFRDDMRDLVEVTAENNKAIYLQSDIRNDVMKYFYSDRDRYSVAADISPEDLGRYNRVSSFGNYRVEEAKYNKMREGDLAAIKHFSEPMANMIKGDLRLSSADLIIPIPGREKQGWPVRALAKEIGAMTNIHVRSDLWKPRPSDIMDSEAGQSFRAKEDRARRSYRLVLGADDAVKGKVVILVDDNITTGATFRAAAAALRYAGAKEVYLVAATKTRD